MQICKTEKKVNLNHIQPFRDLTGVENKVLSAIWRQTPCLLQSRAVGFLCVAISFHHRESHTDLAVWGSTLPHLPLITEASQPP